MGTPRGTPPKPRKPLRKVSKKRAAVNRKRSVLVEKILRERPTCEAESKAAGFVFGTPYSDSVLKFIRRLACNSTSTQVHEPRTRARFPGSDTILDESNCVAVCAECHRKIHDNPALSEACGLLVRSGGANG